MRPLVHSSSSCPTPALTRPAHSWLLGPWRCPYVRLFTLEATHRLFLFPHPLMVPPALQSRLTQAPELPECFLNRLAAQHGSKTWPRVGAAGTFGSHERVRRIGNLDRCHELPPALTEPSRQKFGRTDHRLPAQGNHVGPMRAAVRPRDGVRTGRVSVVDSSQHIPCAPDTPSDDPVRAASMARRQNNGSARATAPGGRSSIRCSARASFRYCVT